MAAAEQSSDGAQSPGAGPGAGALANVPERSTELLLLLDRRGRILDAAPSARHILGLAGKGNGKGGGKGGGAAIVGKSVHDLFTGGNRQALEHLLVEVAGHPEAQESVELATLGDDGTQRRFEGRIANCLDDPALGGLLLSLHDVTQRARSETRLRHIVEASLQGIVVHRGGPALFANDTMAQIIGLGSSSEVLRQPAVGPFIHPDDRTMVSDFIAARIVGEPAPDNYEFRLVDTGGNTVWVDCRSSVIDWDGGGPAVLAALYDITTRKREEEARRASEALFAKVFQASPEIITLTSLGDGRYIDVNDRFTEILGHGRKDIIGRTASDLGVWAEPGFRDRVLEKLHRDGAIRDMETQVRTRTGERVDFMFSAETLPFRGQDVLVIVGRDITEHKARERELQESKVAAEMASRSKSEFLANMSHELRTPLNAVIGFAEVLEKEMFGPLGSAKYIGYAADIRASGRHLLDIINDILDLSKLEAAKMELHEKEISLAEATSTCIRLVHERAREAGLTIRTELPAKVPRLLADPRLVKQILLNLLSNAVKFTPNGGSVTVSARLTKAGECAIAVADTGIGMTKAGIQLAMTPFGQVNSSMTRHHQGSGLGVPLVKSMIERHDGKLAIDSTPGAGTTVTVTFPPERVIH